MFRPIALDSTDSDDFYVESLLVLYNPPRNNIPDIINSTDFSEAHAKEVRTISSVASPEPQIVTIESDSKEPSTTYGYKRQEATIPPSLNDLNQSMKPFNIVTTVSPASTTEAQQCPTQYVDSPINPKIFDISDISTPPVDISTVDDWQTSSNIDTFKLDEPRRLHIDSSFS